MGDPPTIRVRQPADLVGLLPHLLGFHPTNSLVIVALRANTLVVTARLDLPAAAEDEPSYRRSLDAVAAALTGHGATLALLVGYGDADPVAAAVPIATAALTAASIAVPEVLRVHDGRFYSLVCVNPDCCPPHGTPVDPATTAAAATAVYAGLAALPDRASLAAQLAPITGPARDAFAKATIAAAARMVEFLRHASDDDLVEAGRVAWAEAVRCYREGHVLDDARAATLTILLDLGPATRAVASRTTGDDWQIRMWTDLVRRAEAPFAVQPANLLALSALQAGNGAVAAVAIARALAADPDDRLANILATISALGLAPHEIAAILRG